jgi:hypothetical protein
MDRFSPPAMPPVGGSSKADWKAAGPAARKSYFLSPSFLGWHFSQTLPLSAAFVQHLCSHFLPASTVASQQAAKTLLEQKAIATTAITNALSDFI